MRSAAAVGEKSGARVRQRRHGIVDRALMGHSTGKKKTSEVHSRYIHRVLTVEREATEQYDRWQVANKLFDAPAPAVSTLRQVPAPVEPACQASVTIE